MTQRRKSRSIWLDPRTKLVLLLLCIVAASLAPFRAYHTGLVLLVAVYAIMLGKPRYAAGGIGIYAAVYLCTLLVLSWNMSTLRTMFVAFLGLFFKVFPCCMMAGVMIGTTKISEFLSAMNRVHVPKAILIPLTIMLRYMPTIKEDWRFIKDAMKMRDVSPSIKSLFTRPAMTVECIYVPLMMSASDAADDLSIAAVTRGIENPKPRTCLVAIRFGVWDAVFFLAFFAYFLSAFFV